MRLRLQGKSEATTHEVSKSWLSKHELNKHKTNRHASTDGGKPTRPQSNTKNHRSLRNAESKAKMSSPGKSTPTDCPVSNNPENSIQTEKRLM